MTATEGFVGRSPVAVPDPLALIAANPELRIERDDYNINVTSALGQLISGSEALEIIQCHDAGDRPAHLYFHVPLCSYICAFCNYVKKPLSAGESRQREVDGWARALIRESEMYLDAVPWYSTTPIESVYFGGGTATVLGIENLSLLLDHVHSRYAVSEGCEISLEGNPDDFQGDLAAQAVVRGVNRFSLGVQALDDRVNAATGRGHDRAMSLRAVDAISALGVPFNVDMMFGLPHQTVQSVVDDIRTLSERRVPTITIYRLRNIDRQALGIGLRALWNVTSVKSALERKGLFPSLEDTYAMRQGAVELLLESGYRPSPCGWWSLDGVYGEPNIPRVSRNKWQRYDSMIAYGPGAYGWFTGNGQVLQTHNPVEIHTHRVAVDEGRIPLTNGRRLTGAAAAATALGFNFKACQPIDPQRYRVEYGIDLLADEPYASVFETLERKGFVFRDALTQTFTPTLIGETLHEEIISVYFHQRLGAAEIACRRH